MVKRLVIDAAECSGCESCILACAFRHDGVFRMQARLRVERNEHEGLCVPVVCLHCAAAPCAAVCPSDALVRDRATGEIKLIADDCTGCRLCEDECPLGVLVYDDTFERMLKCDLCSGDPECAKACGPGAIVFTEIDEDAEASLARVADLARAARRAAEDG